MKNTFYLCFIALITLASCSKEKEQQSTNNQKNEIKVFTYNDDSRSVITMLEFTDVNHYEATITDLENQVKQHEDIFLSTWSSLNEDALNAKETEIGYNDQQPLIDFENYYNIPSTLRQVFMVAEEQWLNNVELIPENSPSLIYPFGLAELTLLNPDGMVKIGDKIIQLTQKGFVQVSNMDMATVIRIKNGDMTALQEPTVLTSIEDEGSRASCSNWAQKENFIYYDYDNKKIKRHVHFHSYPWKGVSEADITSYKKDGNHWDRYRTDLGVANQSYFRDINCNPGPQGWSGWKREKAKSISKRIANWNAFPQYRAENGVSVTGYFEFPGYSGNLVLTW